MRTHGRKNKKGQSKFRTLKRKRKLIIGGGGTTLKGDDNIVQYKISKEAPTIIYLGKFHKYNKIHGVHKLDLYVDIMPFLVKPLNRSLALVRFDLVWKSNDSEVINRKIQLVAKCSDGKYRQNKLTENVKDYSMQMYDVNTLIRPTASVNIEPSQIS